MLITRRHIGNDGKSNIKPDCLRFRLPTKANFLEKSQARNDKIDYKAFLLLVSDTLQ